MIKKPELLAPAGNLEKLQVAYHYGADAAYIGGPEFGLRAGADNVNFHGLSHACQIAQDRGKQLYVVLNAMPHRNDMKRLPYMLEHLQRIRPSAFIISDAGVFAQARRYTDIDCHISTQASITNAETARYWRQAGATRVVLARECAIDECAHIRQAAEIEVEMFIHGAMCSSYSGKCTISSYTAGRDSNRGGCVQSCRYRYQVGAPLNAAINFMDAKDLMGVDQVGAAVRAGIDSLKIEGRMKSALYVANACAIYRTAIDTVCDHQGKDLPLQSVRELSQRAHLASNRSFTAGNLAKPADAASIRYRDAVYKRGGAFSGCVKAANADSIVIDVRAPFTNTDTLFWLAQDGQRHDLTAIDLQSIGGQAITVAKANSLVRLHSANPLPPVLAIVVKEESKP